MLDDKLFFFGFLACSLVLGVLELVFAPVLQIGCGYGACGPSAPAPARVDASLAYVHPRLHAHLPALRRKTGQNRRSLPTAALKSVP